MKWLAVLTAAVMTAVTGVVRVKAADISEISAKSAIVYNGETGDILFEKNAYEQLPMASTTKIMSVLLVLESGGLDERFVVDSEAIKVEGSSMGLQEGDKVTLRDLCYGMLLPSGNDAANAAAVKVAGSTQKFVELMNDKAQVLGLVDTHFVTPSGLDDDTDEHYSTAYDMARLTAEAMKNADFRAICSQKSAKVCFGDPPYERWLMNSNKLLKSCEGIVGVKTGFTDKARRCLVSACDRNGAELICVTLNAPDDWNDHSKLYDYCFEFISMQALPLDKKKYYLNIVGGDSDKVLCETETAEAVLLNGYAQKVETMVYLPAFAYAPVKNGEQVGKVVYSYNGRVIAEKPIIVKENYSRAEVDKPSIIEYYIDRIKSIFS
ncbi:D-alanyl-D-alanine carboxypeptidase family protein [Ruminococcus sp.]|uniref:D-alanyl-D-alanine carboxypeptidase family protein n=1 Tax=Ruminococcus sp. TaxID=41978 RepID=UPI0025D32B2B|nr:D-alanyl-D-alanine carboxypeptidase family protein [Ruminococcus sp.]